jgi:sulfotransferase 6B1
VDGFACRIEMMMNFFKKIHKKVKKEIVGSTMKHPIFFNSMPKSGTHLLAKALMGLSGIEHSGAHLERKMVAKFVDEGVDYPVEGREDLHIPNDLVWIERLLKTIKPGQFITSHMFYNVPMHQLLKKLDFKILMLLRDPRDVVLSWVDFIAKEQTHLLFPFFSDKDFNFRLIAGIKGVGSDVTGTRRQPPIAELITKHLKWHTDGDGFLVRFEDLIGEKGGGSREIQQRLIKDIADFLEVRSDDHLIVSICDELFGGTYTFNKGQIGRWRNMLSDETKSLFKSEAGGLLIQMGYEPDLNW